MSRLNFAVVREDPDLESVLVQRTQARAALVVASGGCTALTLAHRFPQLRVAAFDNNPAQVQHLREKCRAVSAGDLTQLNVDYPGKDGLNQCGAFEGHFRAFLRIFQGSAGVMRSQMARQGAIRRFFTPSTPPDERREILSAWTHEHAWSFAFSSSFNDAELTALFGPEALQNAEPGTYPAYFQRAFTHGLMRHDAAQNPFLQHVFLGCYSRACAPDYVYARRVLPVDLYQGTLLDVPELGRFQVYSLSNVFDWSDDALVGSWADALRRHAKRGTAVLLRQLNNRRDLRSIFAGFRFDDELGGEFMARDRSLFYNRIEVGFRDDTAA